MTTKIEVVGKSSSSSSNSMDELNIAREGWREAIDLANEKHVQLEDAKRKIMEERTARADTDACNKKIIDEIYQLTLLLTHEVTSRVAFNDSTQYHQITPSTTTTADTTTANTSLNVVLERLKNITSLVSTQDLKLHVSKDEVKRLHSVFVLEKREREERERAEQIIEQKEREHQHINDKVINSASDPFHSHSQGLHHPFSCESIVVESSTITEDTNTVKKVKKKKGVAKR
jgi:hypothetical protein